MEQSSTTKKETVMKKLTLDKANNRVRVQTINTEKSLTQQQFKDHTDINKIMERYQKTGELPGADRQGIFADVSEITDYHSSVQKVLDAQAAFMLLDPTLRNKFGNDPGQMLAFIQDPRNFEEAVKLGIFNKQTNQGEAQKPNELNEQKPAEPQTILKP